MCVSLVDRDISDAADRRLVDAGRYPPLRQLVQLTLGLRLVGVGVRLVPAIGTGPRSHLHAGVEFDGDHRLGLLSLADGGHDP